MSRRPDSGGHPRCEKGEASRREGHQGATKAVGNKRTASLTPSTRLGAHHSIHTYQDIKQHPTRRLGMG